MVPTTFDDQGEQKQHVKKGDKEDKGGPTGFSSFLQLYFVGPNQTSNTLFPVSTPWFCLD